MEPGPQKAATRNQGDRMLGTVFLCETRQFINVPHTNRSTVSQTQESIAFFSMGCFSIDACLFLIEDGGINLRHAEEEFESCQQKWPRKLFDGNCAENHPNHILLVIKNGIIQT